MDKEIKKQENFNEKAWDYSRDLLLAKKGEAYHRKLMEFHKEHIKQIEEIIAKQKIKVKEN